MKKVLIVMDYINEIVHQDGKLSGKGYAKFVDDRDTFGHVNAALSYARENNLEIIHVRLGFSEDYRDQPKGSPLFGKANEYQALQKGTWATEFHESIKVMAGEKIINKTRVSPFYGTDLEKHLRELKVREIYLCGVATDLVVQAAARDAHDRDYSVNILSDCCAAANFEDHNNSLSTLEKIATVGTVDELFN
jgi:ureidoacrylate peracid hydrolase